MDDFTVLDLLTSEVLPALILLLATIIVSLIPAFLNSKNQREAEKLLRKYYTSKDPTKESAQKKFDDTIDELIKNHHQQALLQANVQFWFSIIAAFIGFVSIMIVIFFPSNTAWYEDLINAIPGIISEAVSVLFFAQSKETRQQSSDFLNRLRQDRQYEKSIAIANEIKDEQLKAKLKAEIALHLCGISKSPNDLQS